MTLANYCAGGLGKELIELARSLKQWESIVFVDDITDAETYRSATVYRFAEVAGIEHDVEFVIANTWYGGFAILADGWHEASSLCFRHIWQVCVDKLEDDLVIMAPTRETVLFTPASQKDALRKMTEHGEQAYMQAKAEDKISRELMLFSKDRKELRTYEEKG